MPVYPVKGITQLSRLAIDVDKAWAAMGITNIKEVAASEGIGEMLYQDGTRIASKPMGAIGEEFLTRGSTHSPAWGYPDVGEMGLHYIYPVSAAIDDSSQDDPGLAYNNACVNEFFGKSNVGGPVNAAMIFRNINIPAGALIVNAYIVFTASDNKPDTPTLIIKGEKTASPATYGAAENFTLRALTSNQAVWVPAAWVLDTAYSSADVSPIIRELNLAYGPYVNGTIALQILGQSGTPLWLVKKAYSYDTSPAKAPRLHIILGSY